MNGEFRDVALVAWMAVRGSLAPIRWPETHLMLPIEVPSGSPNTYRVQ
jgi:hypothetical protein